MKSSFSQRISRLRYLARLLDSSIPIPGGYRIGIDGFLGLIPGIGDIAGSLASSYIIIESARLGASIATLTRMVLNVLLESLVGIIPLVGDLFDFFWKANEKNLALLEKQLHSAPPQSSAENRLKATAVVLIILLLAGIIVLTSLALWVLLRAIAAIAAIVTG